MPPDRAVPLAEATFGHTRHVCASFNSTDEEYRTHLPFVKEGFGHGDRGVPHHRRDAAR